MTAVPLPGGDYFARIAGRGAPVGSAPRERDGKRELRYRPSVSERLDDAVGTVGPAPPEEPRGAPGAWPVGDASMGVLDGAPALSTPLDPDARVAGRDPSAAPAGATMPAVPRRRAEVAPDDALVPDDWPSDEATAHPPDRDGAAPVVEAPDPVVAWIDPAASSAELTADPRSVMTSSDADELVRGVDPGEGRLGPRDLAELIAPSPAPVAEPPTPVVADAGTRDEPSIPDPQAFADAFMSTVLGAMAPPPVSAELPVADEASALVIDQLTIELVAPPRATAAPSRSGRPSRAARTTGRLPGGYRSGQRSGS